MTRNNADFQGGNSPITAATCKHCGKGIFSSNTARLRLDNGATYLFPPKEPSFRYDKDYKGYHAHDWGHEGMSEMVMNNEASLGDFAKDPEWNHTPEPADGRSHEEEYQYQAFNTRMGNIAKGISPSESMELAMKPNTHTAHSIQRNGFGVV